MSAMETKIRAQIAAIETQRNQHASQMQAHMQAGLRCDGALSALSILLDELTQEEETAAAEAKRGIDQTTDAPAIEIEIKQDAAEDDVIVRKMQG